jgi:hypothetical protein
MDKQHEGMWFGKGKIEGRNQNILSNDEVISTAASVASNSTTNAVIHGYKPIRLPNYLHQILRKDSSLSRTSFSSDSRRKAGEYTDC